MTTVLKSILVQVRWRSLRRAENGRVPQFRDGLPVQESAMARMRQVKPTRELEIRQTRQHQVKLKIDSKGHWASESMAQMRQLKPTREWEIRQKQAIP